MIAVSTHALAVFGSFRVLTDAERQRWEETATDEMGIRECLRAVILPRAHAEIARDSRILASLEFYLSTGNLPAERILENGDPPFDPPADPIDYFRWVWQELHPVREFEPARPERYREDDREFVVVGASPLGWLGRLLGRWGSVRGG